MKPQATPIGRPELPAVPVRAERARCLVASLLVLASGQLLLAQGVDSRLGFSHTAGELPGLDDGYTRFNSFLPLIGPTDYSLVFADLGFVLFNENTQADGANVGLGLRAYDSLTNRIYGGHFYYDYRDTGHSHYNQLSWGFESLGEMFDCRVNAYLPVGDTWNHYLDGASTSFMGSYLYFTDVPQEVALRGVDGEAVGLLIDQGTWQLRGGAGVYSFWHDNTGVAAIGPRARLELRVADQLWINGSVQHDDEFDTTAALSISWRYGLTRHLEHCSSSTSVACRLGDPVERQDQISIKQYIGGPSTDKLVTSADGHAYTFHHVSSQAAPGGDGSIESPSNTLAAASHQPEDIVLVHGGSAFVGEQFVSSTEGQRVLAEGVPHELETQAGTILLPEVGSGVRPTIVGGAGDVITIAANGVEVSGFDIKPFATFAPFYYYYTDAIHLMLVSSSGIVAQNVNDININRNVIFGATSSGIYLRNVHGMSRVVNNVSSSNLEYGLHIQSSFTGTIAHNSFNDNYGAGLYIFANVIPDVPAEVVGNIVDNQMLRNNLSSQGGPFGGGLYAVANIDGNVSGNAANENGGVGIQVVGSISGDFKDNGAEGTVPYVQLNYSFIIDDSVGFVDGNGEVDNAFGNEEFLSRPWFAADLPNYNPNDVAVLAERSPQDLWSGFGTISAEQRRVGVPLLVWGAVGGEVSGNAGSVTTDVNLELNVVEEYPSWSASPYTAIGGSPLIPLGTID